ncbi:MAG: 50S ribosomal protein L17 [Deltaproteobacteria bacterium]|nr:50S ribosomal protein L17 [Deltaproteobacteria bacterium]
MRHNKDIRRFSRNGGHLRCMVANMTSDFLFHGRIRTTTAKAKEIKRYAEKMITLGKAGNLSARRRAMAFMRSKVVVTKLFADIAPIYKDRNGGYTRVIKCGIRPGDCAPMAILELVDFVSKTEEKDATTTEASKGKKAPAKAKTEKKAEAKPKATAKPKAESKPKPKAAAKSKTATEKKVDK